MGRASIPIVAGHSSMFDWGYQTVEILIGNPPQKFNALLDISQPDTTIPSIRVEEDSDLSDDDAPKSYRYDDAKSSTSKKIEDDIVEYYMRDVNLELNGHKTTEKIVVGGIVLENQTFCNLFYARDRSGFFGAGDNVYYTRLGLAPNADSNTETTTYRGRLQGSSILQTMIDRGLLERNVIGIRPARHRVHDGVLHLGWIDSSYTENIVEMPVIHLPDDVKKKIQSPWHVCVHSIIIGDESLTLEDHHAVFTTSTSHFIFTNHISKWFERILGTLGLGEKGEEEGRLLEDYPSITLALGPQQTLFTVQPSVYTESSMMDWDASEGKEGEELGNYRWAPIDVVDEDDREEVPEDDPEDDPKSNLVFLGTAFLRAFYTVFDVDARTISLAPVDTSGASRE